MSNIKKPDLIGYFACNPETLEPEWDEGCVCEDNVYAEDDTGTVGRLFVFADESEAYANERVREALENAAKDTEGHYKTFNTHDARYQLHKLHGTTYAARIRALIPKQ